MESFLSLSTLRKIKVKTFHARRLNDICDESSVEKISIISIIRKNNTNLDYKKIECDLQISQYCVNMVLVLGLEWCFPSFCEWL